MHGAKTIYYCSSNGNGKSQHQPGKDGSASALESESESEPKAAGDGDGDGAAVSVSLANEPSSAADQVRRGSGASVIYYGSPTVNACGSASAKLGKQQQKLSEVNNNTANGFNNGPASSDTVTGTSSTLSNFKRASVKATINGNNLRMETETAVPALEIGSVDSHSHNNNNTLLNSKNTATAQNNGNGKHAKAEAEDGDKDKDTSSQGPAPLPVPSLKPQPQLQLDFAHPIHDAPAKCNLVDSIRTLFLDVIVTNAVSPLNFSIQSYKDYGKLKLLEAHMTNWYKSYCGSSEPLQFDNLKLNGFYAVKYTPPSSPAGAGNGNSNSNGVKSKSKSQAQSGGKSSSASNSADTDDRDNNVQWRRCQIIKPFSQSLPILTNLVDHGCYFMTEPKNIQPLRKMYTELPCQSLEAKLHFVDTKKIQFTPEDCHLFHKQVEGKPFCSIIMKPLQQQPSTSSPDDSKVSVVLIDTSGEKDHYIHHDYTVPKKKS